MKKLLCLFLTIMLVMTIGSVSSAAPEDTTTENSEIQGAARNVNAATYDPETTEIKKDTPEISPGIVEIDEQEVPLAPALPSTGGIPAEAFYVAGALFVVAALILALKKDKTRQSN
jgi:LPXTG-motif cell wall-anchored protein